MNNIFNKLKIVIKVLLCFNILLFSFYNIVFSQSVYYDFDVDTETLDEYNIDVLLEDLDLTNDNITGPYIEFIKSEISDSDIYKIINYVDEHFSDVLNEEQSKIIYANSENLTVGRGSGSDYDNLISKRDRKIDASIRIKTKSEDVKNNKEEKEPEHPDGNKIIIYIKSSTNNNTNPVSGSAYKANYIFYTECETLEELMHAEGLTEDSGFITTIDGVTANETLESEYSDDFMHGKWSGTSWVLYVNGKKSDLGASDVVLENNMRIKWIEEFSTMTW